MSDPREIIAAMPVARARQAVVDSGRFVGIEGPLYSDDGETWHEYWLPTDDRPTPKLAKIIIERDGVAKPRTVVISWDEYAVRDEDSDEWRELWRRQPMTMFGAAVERQAYWVLFGDVLQALAGDEVSSTVEPPPAAVRDWSAEISAEGLTPAAINALYAEARKAGAFARNDDLQSVFVKALERAKEAIEAEAGAESAPEPVPEAATPISAALPPDTVAALEKLRDNLPPVNASPPVPKPSPRPRASKPLDARKRGGSDKRSRTASASSYS